MIVDSDKHPEQNIFFIGAMLLHILYKNKKNYYDIMDLFRKYNNKNKVHISFDYFLLGLDWLFVLGKIKTNEIGDILLCI
ncbi:TPA: ABC-three component system middle component 6 [Legionella feeleii]